MRSHSTDPARRTAGNHGHLHRRAGRDRGATGGQPAPTDVVINEMMFHALSDLDGDDYLELHNRGTTPVDLSGWTFSGITLTLPAGTTIAAGGFLVVAKDAVAVPGHLRLRPRRRLRRQPVQLRRDRRPQGRHRRHHRHASRFLDVDPWPVHRRRQRPVPGAHRRHPRQQRPAQLGGRHQRQPAAPPAPPTPYAGSASARASPTSPPPRQPGGQPARHGHRHHHRPDQRRPALPHRLQRRADRRR